MELITGGELLERIQGRPVLTEIEVFSNCFLSICRSIACLLPLSLVLPISTVWVLYIVISRYIVSPLKRKATSLIMYFAVKTFGM